jgi:DNA-binding protein YbaB
MVLPRQPLLDDSTMQFVRDEMLRSFAEDGYPPIEVSEADLVSVVMDARFQVRTITLTGVPIGTEEVARLERALVTAMNRANHEVIRHSADRLSRALDQARSYAGPEDKRYVSESPPDH